MYFSDMVFSESPEKILIRHEKNKILYSDVLEKIERTNRKLVCIREDDPVNQLKFFMNLSGRSLPVITPSSAELTEDINIPFQEADFAVATSGTTSGKPKLLFRTLKSWSDFFPQQNKIFHITNDSRIFLHGSFSFTGNLNLAVGAAFAGAELITSISLRPEFWSKQIMKYKVNTIYLIPDKLIHLCKSGIIFTDVRTVICGSQLISKEYFLKIRRHFPNAEVILYYGSSEASYISYNIIQNDFESETCVGQVFPGVKVFISDQHHILVQSPYCICGAGDIIDTGDCGYFDQSGNLHFIGRSDDIINISGQKLSKSYLQKLICSVPDIEECAVKVCVRGSDNRKVVHAWIAGKKLPETIPPEIFSDIPSVFVPKKWIRCDKLPRNSSGKVQV